MIYLAVIPSSVISNVLFERFLVTSMISFSCQNQFFRRSGTSYLHKNKVAFCPSLSSFLSQIGITFCRIQCPYYHQFLRETFKRKHKYKCWLSFLIKVHIRSKSQKANPGSRVSEFKTRMILLYMYTFSYFDILIHIFHRSVSDKIEVESMI